MAMTPTSRFVFSSSTPRYVLLSISFVVGCGLRGADYRPELCIPTSDDRADHDRACGVGNACDFAISTTDGIINYCRPAGEGRDGADCEGDASRCDRGFHCVERDPGGPRVCLRLCVLGDLACDSGTTECEDAFVDSVVLETGRGVLPVGLCRGFSSPPVDSGVPEFDAGPRPSDGGVVPSDGGAVPSDADVMPLDAGQSDAGSLDASRPTPDSGLADACLNEADAIALMTADLLVISQSCGVMTLAAEPATSDCIRTMGGVSVGCAACFGDLVRCVGGSCLDCAFGDVRSPGCTACRIMNCGAAFEACTGTPAF
jgi:hypothetical protein